MSYILDALRKADAQRERDASRGIHAQPAPVDAAAPRAFAIRTIVIGAIALAVVLVGVKAWFPAKGALPEPAATSIAPAQPVKMATPQTVANSIVPPPARVIAPPDAANASQQAMRGMPQANTVPGAASGDAARQAREAAFARAAQQPYPPIAGPAPPGAPQGAQAPQTAPTTAGLPPDAPKIAISGGVYSPSPAQRMLIVNGQVFNEGSEVAPGVTIEKIEARTAVLKFRGARYTVAY